MSRIKDRTGILSSGVKVLSFDKIINNEAYWNCECPVCHKIWQVRGSHLNEPSPISMCKNCSSLKTLSQFKKPFYKDLTNKRFGKLIALEKLNRENSRTYLWKCKCDCGNECIKEAQYLLNEDVQSCGCTRSKGENLITAILTEQKIPFEKEKNLFEHYRFDFYVNNTYIIEFDGIQHFKNESTWGTLSEIRENDLKKNKYCFDNNIPIIRIPYYIKNINIQDLLLNTSNFILTKENENEYYSHNK